MAEKPPFAEPDALAEWIGEGIDATSADWKRARRVLRAASNLVRTQTGRDWLNDDGTLDNPLPEQLVDVTVACAARFYLNPNAETQWSRQIDDAMDGGSRQDDAWRRQLDQLISNSGAWNDAATGTKPYITDLINRINQIMNTTGGYTYLKPGQGIYVYDKPEDQNPTQCIHIGGGYWRIANSKKANGDWDFRALADGNGIYANTIYTGKLSDAAGHNQWNLDTGELTTRGMTATSITAEGTFACGSKDWYGIELNSIGQLAGYRKGKKVGYIDYSGGMYEVSNPSKVYYGLQLQGGCLRISTPILSVAKTTDTHVTTTHAYNGKHHYISKITSSSDGTITWFQSTTEYINGFCIN